MRLGSSGDGDLEGRAGVRARGEVAGQHSMQERAHRDVQLFTPRWGNGRRGAPQRRPFSAPSSTTAMLNASVAEAEEESARRRARGGAHCCCAAWRRGRSSGAGDGAGTGARCALYGQRTSTLGTAERRTGVRARRRASSFGARPWCRGQRAQRRRERESRAGGCGQEWAARAAGRGQRPAPRV